MDCKSFVRSVMLAGGVLALPATQALAVPAHGLFVAPQYDGGQPAAGPDSQPGPDTATPSWIHPLQPESPSPGPDALAPRWHGVDLDRTIDSCVGELGREHQVDDVDSVSRDNGGWRVHGRLVGGTGFSCEVAANGLVSDVLVESRLARNDVRLPTPQPAERRLDPDDPNADVAGPNDQAADPSQQIPEPPRYTDQGQQPEPPRYSDQAQQPAPPHDARDQGSAWQDGDAGDRDPGQTY